MMFSLQLHNLSKRFGSNRVLEEVSLSHDTGVLGIAGPNGSGKSTLLRCMGGLLRPDSGRLTWHLEGTETDFETVRSRLGYAAPYIALYGELSLRENLAFLRSLRKMSGEETQADEIISRVELDHVSGQPYAKLSTGQQQRARLAAALFTDPDVLLLDEPGSNLDRWGRALIEDIIRQAKEREKLVIVATNSEEELALCDRIYSVRKEEMK